MLAYHEALGGRGSPSSATSSAAGGRAARSGDERLAAHALAREPATTARVGAWRETMSADDRPSSRPSPASSCELGYDA